MGDTGPETGNKEDSGKGTNGTGGLEYSCCLDYQQQYQLVKKWTYTMGTGNFCPHGAPLLKRRACHGY